ncbi:MAG TPA: type I 3-dehydroquinate dehydratase, partial [Terriglobales bacterium]|nr:type I 3-dehydroquinate dehydratase [Terriglobales bacterium]
MGKLNQPEGPFGRAANRICAVTAAASAVEMAWQIRSALRETRTIELRLDWLRSDTERTRLLNWLKRHKPRAATFLATCRSVAGGGKFRGDLQSELYWLIRAREAGCSWCDVEVETMRRLPDQSMREYAVPPKVLLSEHDFARTPRLPKSVNPPAPGEADA